MSLQPQSKMIDEHGRYLPFVYPEEVTFWEATRQRQLTLWIGARP